MKFSRILCFIVLASSLSLGQGSTSNSNSDSTSVSDELKKLQNALSEQQKQIIQQQQQMSEQQKEIEKLRQQVTVQQVSAKGTVSPQLVNATLNTTNITNPATMPASDAPQEKPQPEAQGSKSPLSFRIGAAEFTPGGFADFENIFRTTNTGNVAATSFWAIPFSNTAQGHLTEFRSTGQYSRLNLKTNAKFGENDVTGYVEMDFNGNDAANVFVTSNPHTDRLRLYWLDVKRGKWEFLGGQTWGLLTPNRVGVSPNPSDVFLTYGEDAQVHVGINYTRAAEFRVAYHFTPHFVWAGAIENPQQFGGQGEITFPAAFNAVLGTEIDSAANAGAPNVGPDVMTKMAFDSDPTGKGRNLHFEVGGLFTRAKVTAIPVGGTTFVSHSMTGAGIQGDLLFDIVKGREGRGVRFVADGLWGPGVGRYLIGMAPELVALPIATGVGTFDLELSPVHSGNALAGFEVVPAAKSQLGFYGGAVYAGRNTALDVTKTGAPAFIGFGGPNSSNNNNRTIQEATFDWTQTFWKNPQYGSVLMVNQLSYLSRSPWFVAAGAPKDAHLVQAYVSLRYVLP
jgi:hypothetical protein